jgi:hypothetical protein
MIPSTGCTKDGGKVVLSAFDCFPSIQSHGDMTWTPAEKTIDFKRQKAWCTGGNYTIRCEGDPTEKGGTQCYITQAGATKCSDEGSRFSIDGGSVSMAQLIFVDPPEKKRTKMTLSNMKRPMVSAETGTADT